MVWAPVRARLRRAAATTPEPQHRTSPATPRSNERMAESAVVDGLDEVHVGARLPEIGVVPQGGPGRVDDRRVEIGDGHDEVGNADHDPPARPRSFFGFQAQLGGFGRAPGARG